MAYGITSIEMIPRMFYIDEGMVYAFDQGMPALNVTTNWIDSHQYKNSTNQFVIPGILTENQLKIEYVKRAVRQFHIKYLEKWLDKLFRFLRWTYFVNDDPTDFSKVVIN